MQCVAVPLHVRQFELHAVQTTGDVPLVKNPLPHAPQVLLLDERMLGAEQEVQDVALPLQVRQLASHG